MADAGGGGDCDLRVWIGGEWGGAGFDGGDFGGEVEGDVGESGGADVREDGLIGGGDEKILWRGLVSKSPCGEVGRGWQMDRDEPPSIHSSNQKNFKLCRSSGSPTNAPHISAI